MKGKTNMSDFVRSRCEAVKDQEKFLDDWFKTNRNPCSICGKDKSPCCVYKELSERVVIGEKGNLL